ncbi:phosphatidylinositol glycan [Heterostelium album PN500]|uniref:Phosphatidylinositol glycan n=1 Tax=Heterostelium pallidum (strain ATCC 26659 / Pp 5 / PN500) TaxID=670386 RepID=D3BMW4_HETP5|nr:phosphatidylinositol glycan [Heterostelium album PN500]EFA77326.1 phosphatidylinositol glycan [Heterostelium album PN500]|eukprot:XP_020429455.1 phosphatidylinositol glycan [Heterostelium album PN500]
MIHKQLDESTENQIVTTTTSISNQITTTSTNTTTNTTINTTPITTLNSNHIEPLSLSTVDSSVNTVQMYNRTTSKSSSSPLTITKYLVYLSIVIAIGAYLFFTGFLLIRFELPLKSQCSVSPLPSPNRFVDLIHQSSSTNRNVDKGCWMPPTYRKAVIVVIDALRFDFVQKQSPNAQNLSPYFHNHLNNLTSLLETKKSNSILYKFMADSPTVTMQRIKGITTGSLPTFIDVGSNFGGDAIVEDNLIHQLSFHDNHNHKHDVKDRNNEIDGLRKKVVFIGDDTWVSLFPNHFYSQYPFPSFNVKDLHTVDNGVIDNLLPTITRMQTDKDGSDSWHIAIGHLLGVDHVGHLHGPYHPEMIKKLTQMDEFLLSVYNDTLFVLLGDHGMTPDGNHGGSSPEEMEAALFMYSPGHPINSDLPAQFRFGDQHGVKNVSQIDLVSTLSLLLGVPIPYGNLGAVIPELFLGVDDHQQSSSTVHPGWYRLIDAQRINAWQIKRYLESYSQVSKEFPVSILKHYNQLMDRAEQDYSQLKADDTSNFYEVYRQYRQFQEEVVVLCREIWATFDTFAMMAGLSIMSVALVTILVFIYVLALSNSTDSYPMFPAGRIFIYSMVGAILSIPSYLVLHLSLVQEHSFVITLITSTAIVSMIGMISSLTSNTNVASLNPLKYIDLNTVRSIVSQLPFSIMFLLPLLSIILHGVSQSSNSFIESQQNVGVDAVGSLYSYYSWHLEITAKQQQRHSRCNQVDILQAHRNSDAVVWCVGAVVGTVGASLVDMDSDTHVAHHPIDGRTDATSTVDTLQNRTGHEYQFNKIQFDAATIGFEEHVMWRDGLLVILNTFASPIFFALFLPIYIIYSLHLVHQPIVAKVSPPASPIDSFSVLNHNENNTNNTTTTTTSSTTKNNFKPDNSSNKSLRSILIGYLLYLIFFLFNTINICISVYMLRRHLMVWRVFAPKYLFETVQLLIVMLFLVISSLLITCIKSKIKN